MPQATVAEEVTVTGTYETISTSTQAAATTTYDLVNKLPLAGTMQQLRGPDPRRHRHRPGRATHHLRRQSYENLFMVNGVSIKDNVRGTPHNLFIEDAVQETTTPTAAISAEYGRFAGGVVNTLTKSGGNEFHGSFRVGLDTGDDSGSRRQWRSPSRCAPATMTDTINKTYKATLGGFILKDKLWFFAGGRFRKTRARPTRPTSPTSRTRRSPTRSATRAS